MECPSINKDFFISPLEMTHPVSKSPELFIQRPDGFGRRSFQLFWTVPIHELFKFFGLFTRLGTVESFIQKFSYLEFL